MPSTRSDDIRDYAFASQAQALRAHARLTQRALAALLGVSDRAIQAWESGLAYPTIARLQRLIALCLERGAFGAGREQGEAAALWDRARARAGRHLPPFDPSWFASLPRPPALPAPVAPVRPQREDWGDAPAALMLRGRADELDTLARWVDDERCRVVTVLGMGGIGKTTLTAALARAVAPRFDAVYWRSLRNAPPVEEWLAGAIAALSPAQALPPDGLAARLDLLLDLVRERRALLVLDNLESVLEPGVATARYRAGYDGYDTALRRLSEGAHRGCVVVTSRERLLRRDDGDEGAVRALRLGGLEVDEGRALLERHGLMGDAATWDALVARYAGNPLALRVVGETIGAVFGGDIAAFLAQDATVFGDIRQLLDEQVERLSAPERALLTALAVEREPVGFAEVVADLGLGVARGDAVEAVEALQRRSLLERAAREGGAFMLQPVVLEYATARLVEQVAGEVLAGEPALLVSQALLQARAKDYVRRSQERLIARPLLERLGASGGAGAGAVERRLLALLEGWRGRPWAEQGYGPGNVVNLLRLLRGELRGLDLSGLAIRQAYLQGVAAQDASVAGAHLTETALAEAFAYPRSVALSADGAYLAAGTSAGEVRLWRVADRTPLRSMHGHSGTVWGVAISGDNRLAASGGQDGTVRLWEVPSGRPLATLEGHAGIVWGVALSGDGQLVASGNQDGTVRLWEASNGRLLATLEGHSGPVLNVALSGDGWLAAAGGQDGIVRLWEVSSGRLLATLEGHNGPVLGVAFSGDGQMLASGGQDGTVRLWEAPGGRLLATVQGRSGGVRAVALSGDGLLVASGNQDGTARLWEVPSGRPLATLEGHGGPVLGVALSEDGQLVASGGLDGTVRLWEAPGGRLLATVQGQSGLVLDVALSGDGQLVASGNQDGTVRLWEASNGRLLATLEGHNGGVRAEGHSGGVRAVALSGDGQVLASGNQDGTVRLWEPRTGRPLATLEGHSSAVWGVALSGDGQLVASGGLDGTVQLWEVPSGRPLATLEGHTSAVWGVALSGDGRLVASGGQDGTVRLWEAPSGRSLATLEGHSGMVWGVALSRNGQVLASGGLDGTVRRWEIPSGRPLATLEGHTSTVWGVALSGDGQVLASGSFDGTARLWEIPSGQLLVALEGHSGGVLGVALSGDGQVLASGSLDGTVRLWEARTGAALRTLRGERPYERMDITGLTGVTEAQRRALLGLGAVESRL